MVVREIIRSERGNTLLLVFGFIIVLSLIAIPMLTLTSNGLLQSVAGANAERAYALSESGSAIYKRLFAEAAKDSALEESDLISLKDQLASLHIVDRIEIERAPDGKIAELEFATRRGEGARSREKVVTLAIASNGEPSNGGIGENAGVTGEEFYFNHAVVTQKPPVTGDAPNGYDQNKHIRACPADPNEKFYNNGYDEARYASEFAAYLNHFYSEPFNKAFQVAPVSQFILNEPLLTELDNNAASGAYVYKGTSGMNQAGVDYSGNINFADTWVAMSVAAMPDGVSIRAKGSLQATNNYLEGVQFLGDVLLGKNLELGGARSVGFGGNLKVRGNAIFNNSLQNPLRIAGDFIVGGNASFRELNELVIEGDFIVGGNLDLVSISNKFEVKGDLIVYGNLNFNSTIGRGIQVSGDIIVGNKLYVNTPIADSSVGGSVLVAKDVQFTNPINSLVIQGDFYAGNNLIVQNVVVGLQIAGNVLIGGTANFSVEAEIKFLLVEGNFYVRNTLVFRNTITQPGGLKVNGSLVSGGPLTFENNIVKLEIGGGLISLAGMEFRNTGGNTLQVGKDIIANGNMVINNNGGQFVAGGYLMAKNNLTFAGEFSQNPVSQFAGLYAGGTTTFQGQGTRWHDYYMCITHNTPQGTGGNSQDGGYAIGGRSSR